MSLYTFSKADKVPTFRKIEGLQMQRTDDHMLMAKVNDISLEEARRRMESGNIAFVAKYNNIPVAFGWVATVLANIGELNHKFTLPERHAYLWNFRTVAEYRGLGIYPALLNYILASTAADFDRYWIIHAPENIASRNGIVKAGFEYVGQLHIGQSQQLEFMEDAGRIGSVAADALGLPKQNASNISCWNCSSPFVKKRQSVCCCATQNKVCVNNGLQLAA